MQSPVSRADGQRRIKEKPERKGEPEFISVKASKRVETELEEAAEHAEDPRQQKAIKTDKPFIVQKRDSKRRRLPIYLEPIRQVQFE